MSCSSLAMRCRSASAAASARSAWACSASRACCSAETTRSCRSRVASPMPKNSPANSQSHRCSPNEVMAGSCASRSQIPAAAIPAASGTDDAYAAAE